MKPNPSNPLRSHRFGLGMATMLLALAPTLASAQAADPAPAQVYSLTPEQKSSLLADREVRGNDPTLPLLSGVDRQVHGEIGALIGSNGTRAMFGTAAVPLGENGGAVVSFESSRYGGRRYR